MTKKGKIVINTNLDENSEEFRTVCSNLAVLFHCGKVVEDFPPCKVSVASPFQEEG